jgi:steroid 5-alpha reductase family enzyme
MHPLLLTALICVGLNGAGFINGFFQQTDKLTDLLYSASFALAAALAWWIAGQPNGLAAVLLGLVLIWAFRLGSYLFRRIVHMGKDDRFDQMRPNPLRLAGFWTLQTVTVWIILLPFSLVLALYASNPTDALSMLPEITSGKGLLLLLGLFIWLFGFVLETVADAQKFRFKQAHPKEFMHSGVWRRLRHPNYTGEILVWIGFALVASSVLSGWSLLLAWISPLWIALLLIKVSGIPLLEQAAEKRYGKEPAFQDYVASSHRLIPGIW